MRSDCTIGQHTPLTWEYYVQMKKVSIIPTEPLVAPILSCFLGLSQAGKLVVKRLTIMTLGVIFRGALFLQEIKKNKPDKKTTKITIVLPSTFDINVAHTKSAEVSMQ